MKIAILSPAFPPAVNGLGDYSGLMGDELQRQASSIQLFYFGLEQEKQVVVNNYSIVSKFENQLSRLVEDKGIDFLFVNYSNYGYQSKGVPFWLVQQVAMIKGQKVKVITFFHELDATGKIWQSVFWLKPFQQSIFKKLYRLSDYVFCSNDRIFEILAAYTYDKGQKTKHIGLFSNIPEPIFLLPFFDRQRSAVVFGTYGRRKALYAHGQKLNQFCTIHKIQSIIDIGGGDVSGLIEEISVPVIVKGELAPDRIAAELQANVFGFIDYAQQILGKSGIFAAYACNGMVIANFSNEDGLPLDGLINGVQYYDIKTGMEQIEMSAMQAAGQKAYQWYQPRNLEQHVNRIVSVLPIITT